jgi:hypothetical protein
MSRGFRIAKDDLLTDDVTTVGMRHDEGKNIVALDFETLRLTGSEQGFEESKCLSAVFWKNVKLQECRPVLPGTCDRYRTKPYVLAIGL